MKTLLVASSIAVLLVASARAEVEVVKSPDPLGGDAPYEFELQKTKMEFGSFHVWGTVKAAQPDRTTSNAMLVLTAYDADGGFLGRGSCSIGPQVGGGGMQRGYVDDCTLDTDEVAPAKLVWEVVAPGGTSKLPEVVESEEETAQDASLTFVVQKVGENYGGYSVVGKVTNDTEITYENVQVIVTAYGADGEFLGRSQGSAQPSTVGKGQVGYVDNLGIDTGGRQPVKLEWKVVSFAF